MAKDIPWELYRSLLSVLQEGSLSAAARALGLTQPTVGRHIDALEQAVGQSLFTRTQQGMQATELAWHLSTYAQTMHNTAAALQRAISGGDMGAVAGTVRISAPETVTVEVLPHIVASLIPSYPDLRIELVPTDQIQDVLQREVDIAVRMLPPAQDVLIARKVAQVELGLFAHADYLQRNGQPEVPEDLARHSLIGFCDETPFLRKVQQEFPLWHREAFSWRSNSALTQLAWMRAGAGIGVCQVALANQTMQLKRVLPHVMAYQLECWVTMHAALRSIPRYKVVFDVLAQGLIEFYGRSDVSPMLR